MEKFIKLFDWIFYVIGITTVGLIAIFLDYEKYFWWGVGLFLLFNLALIIRDARQTNYLADTLGEPSAGAKHNQSEIKI